ncbi:polysaccharide lyase family 8 super-sandwich domain-containing protein [Paenibacillus dendritiformis]|uniref:polysaccharide lyase family 8 super-sandwich domain-containing protein n=1 Tax=Paenibacillus dendritiformis TaxID=130049 RepID=UPI0018CE85C3|nr:polysaccharide lyase family 8 super-sandwich domain-containing protein [Paenibacillus dendritiformis]
MNVVLKRWAKVRRVTAVWLALLLIVGCLPAWPAQAAAGTAEAAEFDKLRARWVEFLTGGTAYDPADPDIASAIEALSSNVSNAEGSGLWDRMNKGAGRAYLWSDLQGTASDRMSAGYVRLKQMALAYSTYGSPLYRNEELKRDIVGGLDWMYANRYNENKSETGNWWDWEIGTPQHLNDTVVLIVPDPTRRTNLPSLVETGATRLDKALVVIIRGALEMRSEKIEQGRDAISQVFDYVTRGDGFYKDGSFIQHVNIAYTGSYGGVLLNDMGKLLTVLADSPWAITDPKLEHDYNWVADSYDPLVYRGKMMDMVFGRARFRSFEKKNPPFTGILRMARYAPKEIADDFNGMVKNWILSDSTRTRPYDGLGVADIVLLRSVIDNPDIPPHPQRIGHTTFAGMDRISHLREDYAFGIEMSSSRIANYENSISDSVTSWHIGEGMTFLYNADALQFNDGFWPTVNPFRLPGTTSDGAPRRSPKTTSKSWVGGTSIDGLYGAAGMDLNPDNSTLAGKKSWFLFDDEIVALGAGIHSTDNREIETIVENRKINANGDNALTINGETQPAQLGWSDTVEGVRWAHLEGNVPGAGVGYYFPNPAAVTGLREARTGAWSSINQGDSAAPITRNYVSLALEHGTKPSDAAYSYVLLPYKDAAATEAYSARPDIEIIRNSADVQAVRETRLGLTRANFWQAGTADLVRSEQPASVIVKEEGNELTVSVSDPTKNQGSLMLEIGKPGFEVLAQSDTVTVLRTSPTIQLKVNAAGSLGTAHRVKLTYDAEAPVYFPPVQEEQFAPLADTFVWDGANANTNFGSSTYLVARNGGSGFKRQTFLKFDLGGYTSEVNAAKLWVYGSTDLPGGVSAFAVADDSWTESEATWNRKPALGQKLDTASFETAAGWKAFEVTSFVQSELSGDGIVSIGIDTADNRYASRTVGKRRRTSRICRCCPAGRIRRRQSRPMMLMMNGTGPRTVNLSAADEGSGYGRRWRVQHSGSGFEPGRECDRGRLLCPRRYRHHAFGAGGHGEGASIFPSRSPTCCCLIFNMSNRSKINSISQEKHAESPAEGLHAFIVPWGEVMSMEEEY